MKEGGGGASERDFVNFLAKHNENNDHPCGNGGRKTF